MLSFYPFWHTLFLPLMWKILAFLMIFLAKSMDNCSESFEKKVDCYMKWLIACCYGWKRNYRGFCRAVCREITEDLYILVSDRFYFLDMDIFNLFSGFSIQ